MTAPLFQTPALNACRPDLMTVEGFDKPVGAFAGDLLVACTMTRSMTQASTIALTFADPTRQLMTSPLLNQAVTISVGCYPDLRFTLVQVQKSKDQITAGFEDALINKLRGIKGPWSVGPGAMDRVAFVRHMLYDVGTEIDVIGPADGATPKSLVPLTRGTAQDPNEDTWACITRLAQDVGYRAFSDGHSIWFAPDDWLMNHRPLFPVAEFTDLCDYVDFDYDAGKPVSTATIFGYSTTWSGPIGAGLYLSNMAAANGSTYLVSEISRDLFHTPVTVKVVANGPSLPEPTPDDAGI
jgi:hypothetical protein